MPVEMNLRLSNVAQAVADRSANIVAGAAEMAKAEIQALTPVKSGKARASIEVNPSPDGMGFTVTSDIPYMAILEFGGSRRPAFAMFRRGLAKVRSRLGMIAASVGRSSGTRSPLAAGLSAKIRARLGG